MAEKVIAASLTLNAEQANQSVKTFRSQLREANQELLQTSSKFGETSTQAATAAKKVAELRDRMGDAKNLVDAFNPDRKFQAFGNTISGIAGGFAAVQGALALVGAESEDTQKALLKVQGALALSQGVNSVLELKDSFRALGTFIQSTTVFQKLNTAATKAAAAVQNLFTGAVNTTSTSFKVLKGAIAATGIGLLVVAIGTVVEALQSWSSAAEDAAAAQKSLDETAKKGADLQLKTEQESLTRSEKIEVAKAQARDASEKEIFAIQTKYQNLRINSQNRHFLEVNRIDKIAGEESKKASENLQIDRELNRLQFEKKQREKAEEDTKKQKEKDKTASEKDKQNRKERLEHEKAANAELQKLRDENYLSQINDEDQRERQKIILEGKHAQDRIYAMEQFGETERAILKEIRKKTQIELDELNKSVEQKQKEKEAERLNAGKQAVLTDAAAVAEVRKELSMENMSEQDLQLLELQSWYDKRLEVVKGNAQLEAQLTESFEKKKSDVIKAQGELRLGMVSNFLAKGADLVGKQTVAGKVLAVAGATIDTYQAANKALNASYGIFGPAAQIARIFAVTATIAMGLKNIKEIIKVQVPGGGGGGSSVPAVSASAPLTPTPQVATTQLDQNSLNSINNATTRAYVVESDVTNGQERMTRLNRAARLGG